MNVLCNKKLFQSICFLIIVFFGCVEKKQTIISESFHNKLYFNQIIIDKSQIINSDLCDDYINSLKKQLTTIHDNVQIVKRNNRKLKIGQLLIIPQRIWLDYTSAKNSSNDQANARLESTLLVETENFSKTYNQFSITEGDQTPGAVVLGQVLLAPIFLFPVKDGEGTTKIISKEYSIDAVLEKNIKAIVNNILTSNSFKEANNSTKISLTKEASIILTVHFEEMDGLVNKTIDAGEKFKFKITSTNQGEGTAFDVKLFIKSKYPGINFAKSVELGDIAPGETIKNSIPISADIMLAGGTASFKVNAKERRGYDARPIELQIPTAKLQSPKLMFASNRLNDSSGMANGDGDNQPENNEIIEVNTYIKNEGVGDALKVKVQLSEVSEGLEIIKTEDELVKLSPGATKKTTLAFKIPRTYSQQEIKYTIIATDIRGMRTEKSYTIPFNAKSPKLKFSYKIIGQNNNEVPFLENGKSYRLMIIPENIGNNFAQNVSTSVQTISGNALIGNFNSDVGIIEPGITGKIITVPIDLRRSFSKTSLSLHVAMEQDSFSGIEKEIILPVQLKQPKLQYKVTLLNGVDDNNISQNSSSNFRISINNQGGMDAENVKIRFRSMKDGVPFNEEKNIGRIRSGANQYEDFTFFVRGDVQTGNFPIKLTITQTDLEPVTSELSYKIVEQTALVQKIKGTGQSISSKQIKNAYAGPPQFYINTPGNNIKIIKRQIDLHGSIITFGAGNATQNLTITLNGRPLSILPVQEEMKLDPNIITKRETIDNKVIFDGSIMLDPGKNVIQISGMDRNGLKGSETIIVTKQATLGNIHAVVIGISEFFNQKYNLEYAADDALKFNNFLQSETGGNLPENRIKFLYNHMATRASIIDAFSNFLGQTSEEDIVEIYMATHGYVGMDGKLYYICHDTDIDNLKGTGFSDEDFTEILSQDIKAGKVIIYLDTCHAGMSGLSELYAKRDIGVINVNRQINKLAAQISQTKNGVAKFSASSANGYSLEDPTLNGGVFTHWLIKGLNGKANENNDEWVNADELERYLRKNVTMATNGKQTPKAILTIDDNTPLAKVK